MHLPSCSSTSYSYLRTHTEERKLTAVIYNFVSLQMVSNDEYKSVVHKVRIKSDRDARVTVATFFNPPKRGDSESDLLGPLPELVTAETPARYRSFTMTEFLKSRAELGHGGSSTD